MADFCSACDEVLDTGVDYDLAALAAAHLKEPGDVYSFPPCEGCMVYAIGIDEAGTVVEWHSGEEDPVPLGSAAQFLDEEPPPPDTLGDAKFTMIDAVVEAYELGEVPTVLVSQHAETGERRVRRLESESASVSLDEGIAALEDAAGQLKEARQKEVERRMVLSVFVRSPRSGRWKAVAWGPKLSVTRAVEIAERYQAEVGQAVVRVRGEPEDLPF